MAGGRVVAGLLGGWGIFRDGGGFSFSDRNFLSKEGFDNEDESAFGGLALVRPGLCG
jgi:hypothetical protein